MRLVNPLARRLIAHGRGSSQLLVLHLTGRKSGRQLNIPVGYHVVDGSMCVFTDSSWRHNFAGGLDLGVGVSGRRRAMRGTLEDDPEHVARAFRRLIDEHGLTWARRHLGIRVNTGGRPPTVKELREMVSVSGLSIIRLEDRTD